MDVSLILQSVSLVVSYHHLFFKCFSLIFRFVLLFDIKLHCFFLNSRLRSQLTLLIRFLSLLMDVVFIYPFFSTLLFSFYLFVLLNTWVCRFSNLFHYVINKSNCISSNLFFQPWNDNKILINMRQLILPIPY